MNGASVGSRYFAAAERIAGAIGRALLARRVAVLIVFFLLTCMLGWRSGNIHLDPGYDKAIPANHPYMVKYEKYGGVFGGGNIFIVALMATDGDIFSESFLKALQGATEDVQYVPGVRRGSVTSIFSPAVTYIAVNEEGFVGGRVVRADFKPDAAGLRELRERVKVSGEIGRTVARDLAGALVRAELVETDARTGARIDYRDVSAALEEIRHKYESPEISVHVIGFPKFIDAITQGARAVLIFFGVALAVTFFLLYLYTGSWLLTTIATAVALVAVVWQLGIVELVGYGIDPLSVLVPFLVLSIAVSHAVQMTNAWVLEVKNGAASAVEAAEGAFRHLFIPGTTALIANAIGFAVIMVIDIPIIRELGVTAGVGVAVMILTNKFLLPALLSYVPIGEEFASEPGGRIFRTDWTLWRIVASCVRRQNRNWVFVVTVGVFAAGVWGHFVRDVGDTVSGAPELRKTSRYNLDVSAVVNHFNVGVDELILVASTFKDGCTDFKVMHGIDEFVWGLKGISGVQGVRVLTDVVKQRAVGNNEGFVRFWGLPRDQLTFGAYMQGIEYSQGLFDHECSAVSIRVFLEDHKAETLARVVTAVKDLSAQYDMDGLRFVLGGGNAGVMAATNEAVIAAEPRILAALFLSVGLLCLITFASWRAALCVLVPLAVVAVGADAVMALLGIGLKVAVLPVVALGVGVGVDYGIYLVSRVQKALEMGCSVESAFELGLRQAGAAAAFTATTMTFSVGLWVFSPIKYQADMGALLAYMFLFNMVAAIVLVPALGGALFTAAGQTQGKRKNAGNPQGFPG